MTQNIVSAVFDDRGEAERAVAELRSAGVRESAISLLGHRDPDDSDRDKGDQGHGLGSIAGSVAAGGVGGALLGVAALAIPGFGPLAAAGAIAASAAPTMAGIGAALGATGGAVAKMLTDHDVEGRDADYYEEHIQRGGVFVSVDSREGNVEPETARDILYRYGGHSASRPKGESSGART